MKRILIPALILVASACNSFKPFTFVQISDTQIGFFDDSPAFTHSDSLMKAAVVAINDFGPDLVINTGDHLNVAGDPVQDSVYRVRAAEIEAPYYLLPGNHDITSPYTLEKRDKYIKEFGYDRFSFKHKGCAFIGLDSNCIKEDNEEANEAEAEQYEWLKKELASAKRSTYIFVFMHCPIFRESFDEGEDYSNFPMPKREKYMSLFKEAGVSAIFYGHLHRDYYCEWEGIKIYTIGSVCNSLGHGTPGYNVVRIGKDGFEAEYVPTPGIDTAHSRLF